MLFPALEETAPPPTIVLPDPAPEFAATFPITVLLVPPAEDALRPIIVFVLANAIFVTPEIGLVHFDFARHGAAGQW